MRKGLAPVFVFMLTLAGCGYFNSLYNARRDFNDAERQRRRGDVASARASYTSSIEKAAKSYRRYPHGRWSDDALYLIARAHFQLADYNAARLAFAELLARTHNRNLRADAHAYAGATALELAAAADAQMHLDSALTVLSKNSDLFGFAHLWRARALAELGNVKGAWADLDAVTERGDQQFEQVQIERLTLAIQSNDSTRARDAFAQLLATHDTRAQLDTLSALAFVAGKHFGSTDARAMLSPANIDLPPAARDSLALLRARIADANGDTLHANPELMDLAAHAAAATASAARVAVAHARLRAASRMEQLADVRTLLLPAISNVDAQDMIRTIRLVDVLVRRAAETGQPLALFAAAEIARDQLGANPLAHQLFVTFADIGAQTPWAGKALLAAIALSPSSPDANALRARLAALPPNPYTTASRGEDAEEAYETAEERLDRSLSALRAEAAQLAQQQESGVTRMVFVLDSVKSAARADTVRTRCGILIDTLALTGIRADSVRSVCLRGDAELLAAYLKIDTLHWKPGAASDTVISARRRMPSTKVNIDTIK